MKRILSSILVAFFFLLNAAAQDNLEFDYDRTRITSSGNIVITPKNVVRRQRINGRKQVLLPIGTDEFWLKTIRHIRDTYFSPEEVKKLQEDSKTFNLEFSIDNKGNVLYTSFFINKAALNMLTEDDLKAIYNESINLKIPITHKFKDTEFVKIHISLLEPYY